MIKIARKGPLEHRARLPPGSNVGFNVAPHFLKMATEAANRGFFEVRYSGALSRTSGARRVLRGGSYWNNARRCRSAYRNENDPGNRNKNIGFRLAAACPPQVATANPVPDALDFGRAGVVTGRVLVGGPKSVRTLPPGFLRNMHRAAQGRN